MQIVTFDSGGVSWHRNHMDTSKGVVAALADLTREDAAYSRVDLLLLVRADIIKQGELPLSSKELTGLVLLAAICRRLCPCC